MTVQQFAIDRDPLARAQADDVAGPDLVDGQIAQPAVAFDLGRIRGEVHQPPDRLPGLALGARLQPAAQQDQRDDDGGAFVIDMARALGQQARREGGDDGIKKGSRRSQHHEAVHLGRAAQQRRHAVAIEDAPRPGQNGSGQQELRDPQRLRRDRRRQPVMEAGEDMAAHLDDEDRQGQAKRGQEGAAQPGRIGIVIEMRALCLGSLGPGGIALRRDQIGQRLRADTGAMGDFGGAGDQIDLGLRDAGGLGQRPLDPTDAGGTAHPLDIQGGVFLQRRIAGAFQCLGGAGQGACIQKPHPCAAGGEVHLRRLDALHGGKCALGPADAGGAAEPAQRQLDIAALNGQGRSGGKGCVSGGRHGLVLF